MNLALVSKTTLVLAALVVCLGIALAASVFLNLRSDDDGAEPLTERYLFVQDARSGSLTPADDQTYMLELAGVDPGVVFFSDRPYRDSGTFSVPALLEQVFDPSDTPPNAALVFNEPGEPNAVTLAFEISEPRYDSAGETLTYRATPLEEASAGLAHLRFDPLTGGAISFQNPALFIDSGSYHRCEAFLINKTEFTFTLAETDPGSGNHWGDYPPRTIAPNSTGWWKFKYHSDSHQKKAVVRYDGGGTDPLGSSYSLEYSITCSAGLIGTSESVVDSDCQVSHFDTFTCDEDVLPPGSTPSISGDNYVTYSLNPND